MAKKPRVKKKVTSTKKKGCFYKIRNYIILSLIMVLIGGAGEKYKVQILNYASSNYKNFSISKIFDKFNTPKDSQSSSKSELSNSHLSEASTIKNSGKRFIIKHNYYTLQYDEETEQPDWVSYTVTKDMILSGHVKRTDDFRVDPWVPTGSATPQDYYKSGYDKGHLCPAGDMAFSKEAMSETFYMSNMSPQKPEFNRGGWKRLEEKERKWAVEDGSISIVDGPIFYRDRKHEEIGVNKVDVPDAYFKVILDNEEQDIKAIGFIMPNSKITKPLEDYAVSVDQVEKVTGLEFYPNLPKERASIIESKADYNKWN